MHPNLDDWESYWEKAAARIDSYRALCAARKLHRKQARKSRFKPRIERTRFFLRAPRGAGFLTLSE